MVARARSFGAGRVVRSAMGSVGTVGPRLPRLPGIGAKPRASGTPQLPGQINGGYAHLDRMGLGAADIAQGHKKLGGGL
jgi:hypothetical protein